MKLYRYMCMDEFNKMSHGCDIVGKKSFKARTSSNGICFLGADTVFENAYYDDEKGIFCTEDIHFDPVQCYMFLRGIVSDDIIVEFEADASLVSESEGVYCNPLNPDECTVMTEYCMPSYNIDRIKPLRYGFVENAISVEWYPFY